MDELDLSNPARNLIHTFPIYHWGFIELDNGKIYRKALYLMVKTHGFPIDFPFNQSNEGY